MEQGKHAPRGTPVPPPLAADAVAEWNEAGPYRGLEHVGSEQGVVAR